MKYKWIIERYNNDPIYVSQSVGEQAQKAKEGGVATIHLPGDISLSAASISLIAPTTDREDDALKITSGLDMKPRVALDDQENVITNWYKRPMSQQEWERKYSAIPAYHRLNGPNQELWLAVRLPEYAGEADRSFDLELCDENDVRLLEHA